MPIKPQENPLLQNLKRIATGGGEKEPLFNRGVLDTIAMIERDGSFTRNRMIGLVMLLKIQQSSGVSMLTKDEAVEAEGYLTKNGWKIEDAILYLDGVDTVERLGSVYESQTKAED